MWLVPRSARLNVLRVEPKGSKCNLKNLECAPRHNTFPSQPRIPSPKNDGSLFRPKVRLYILRAAVSLYTSRCAQQQKVWNISTKEKICAQQPESHYSDDWYHRKEARLQLCKSHKKAPYTFGRARNNPAAHPPKLKRDLLLGNNNKRLGGSNRTCRWGRGRSNSAGAPSAVKIYRGVDNPSCDWSVGK